MGSKRHWFLVMVLQLPPAYHSKLDLDKVYPKNRDRVRDAILLASGTLFSRIL